MNTSITKVKELWDANPPTTKAGVREFDTRISKVLGLAKGTVKTYRTSNNRVAYKRPPKSQNNNFVKFKADVISDALTYSAQLAKLSNKIDLLTKDKDALAKSLVTLYNSHCELMEMVNDVMDNVGDIESEVSTVKQSFAMDGVVMPMSLLVVMVMWSIISVVGIGAFLLYN